jgi:hypothetical protein
MAAHGAARNLYACGELVHSTSASLNIKNQNIAWSGYSAVAVIHQRGESPAGERSK